MRFRAGDADSPSLSRTPHRPRRHQPSVTARTGAVGLLAVIVVCLLLLLELTSDPHNLYQWRPHVHWRTVRRRQLVPRAGTANSAINVSRAFFLHSRIPLPYRYGNDVRLCQVLRELKQQSVVVDYHGWRATNDDTVAALEQLQSLVLGTVQVPLVVQDDSLLGHQQVIPLTQLLCQHTYQLYIVYLWMVPPAYLQFTYDFITLLKQLQPASQLLILTDDVHFARQRQIDCSTDHLPTCHSTTAELMQSIELHLLTSTDAIATVTDEDAATLRALLPSSYIQAVHLMSDNVAATTQTPTVSLSQRTNLLFVGADNPVNEASLKWFCSSILPVIQQSLPTVQLDIVGSVSCAPCRHIKHVACHGQTDDLGPHLQRARVFVAPIVTGTGINTKNILALQSGIPLVTTVTGSRSMHLDQALDAAFVVNTEREFADAVTRLYIDDELWRATSRAGTEHAARHFTSAALNYDITQLLAALKWSSTASASSQPSGNCLAYRSLEQFSASLAE